MNQLWHFLEGGPTPNTMFTPQAVALSLLVAFIMGQLLAWVYYATHSGISYSRSFVQALILMAVVVSLVMAVIGNSIITAFGLMGALALVRFRNTIKDTRDVVFVFCSLVIGMAAGSQRYAVAIIGTAALCLIVIYLHVTSFGSHSAFNAFLRCRVAGGTEPGRVSGVLKRFCGGFALISVQEGDVPGTMEYAYQLTLRDSGDNEEMIAELDGLEGVSDLGLTMQEELLEV
jgi:hypothetical protein